MLNQSFYLEFSHETVGPQWIGIIHLRRRNTTSSLDGYSNLCWTQNLHVYRPWSWCGFQTDLMAAYEHCRKTSAKIKKRLVKLELCHCMCNISMEDFRAPHQRRGCSPSWSGSCGSVHTHEPLPQVWCCFQKADGPQQFEHESENKQRSCRKRSERTIRVYRIHLSLILTYNTAKLKT